MKHLRALALLILAACLPAHADPIFTDGFESEIIVPESCHSSLDPLNLPVGYKPYVFSWPDAMYGNTYPSSGAPLAPVGSFTLREYDRPNGPSIAGRWIAVRIMPSTGIYLLNWLQAQPIHENGYRAARVAEWVYVTISECPGDFRLPDNLAADPFLRTACRKISGSTSMYYSATAAGYNVCGVTAGREHFLNFLFADPRDGLDKTEHSCRGGVDECEVNVRHERQTQ